MNTEDLLHFRAAQYGHFPHQAALAQQLKFSLQNFKAGTSWKELPPASREALEMICHKMARILNGKPDYEDNWQDIAGYATLVLQELQITSKSNLPSTSPLGLSRGAPHAQ